MPHIAMILFVFLATAASVCAEEQVSEEWVARHDSIKPLNTNTSPKGLSIDSSGNIYITVGVENTYTGYTVKYNVNGTKLWMIRYDFYPASLAIDAENNFFVSGSTSVDETIVKYNSIGTELWMNKHDLDTIGLSVDKVGNVHLMGVIKSGTANITSDYGVVKYDPNGNQLWKAQYNGPANSTDIPVALSIDNASNVYVTGKSIGTDTVYGYATVKYDPNGNQLWAARYHGPGTGEDHPVALAVDAAANVYVTGSSVGSGTHYTDYATIKYDSNGNELWVARYNGPANEYDDASAIAVDEGGHIYVTGGSFSGSMKRDFTTIKYDTNGNELWVARYNGPENDYDYPNAIALDAMGNVYVTGSSTNGYATVKYTADGNELWVERYNMPVGNGWMGGPIALAVDIESNVCLTGYFVITRGYDGEPGSYAYTSLSVTIKYDNNGNQLWLASHYGEGECHDSASAIALDAAGNVYVTGQSVGSTGTYDYATIKYATGGTQLWVAWYNGLGNWADSPVALAVDNAGNVYVTGKSIGSNGNFDYATVKYDSSGNELWAARYNGPGNREDYPSGLALDAMGNVYVTGRSYGDGTSFDYATIKYDGNGKELWVVRYNSPTNGYDTPAALSTDTAGNVYVTGAIEGYYSRTTLFFNNYATIKYDTNGHELWVKRYDGPYDSYRSPISLGVDNNSGSVYVTRPSILGYVTVKYDANGNESWVKWHQGSGSSTCLTVDTSGNFYVSGRMTDPNGTNKFTTVKYDANGNELWVALYSGSGNWADSPVALAVDNAGNVCVTGKSIGSNGNFDYATVKYDSSGNELWAARYNGPGNSEDYPSGLALDAMGNVYVTGTSSGVDSAKDFATITYSVSKIPGQGHSDTNKGGCFINTVSD